jgi:hypothetical protein
MDVASKLTGEPASRPAVLKVPIGAKVAVE